MTVRAFAEAHGIFPATMYWWRHRLRHRAQQLDLVPVEVVGGGSTAVSADALRAGGADFELEIDRTTTLRIPAGFDEGDLRRLIRALRC